MESKDNQQQPDISDTKTPSKSSFFKRDSLAIRLITWLMRLIVGSTFIISGFTKGVDPWGTFYKISEYLSTFGFSFSSNLILAAVFLLFGIEFLTGVFIILGCFRKASPWLAAIIMTFMLPLTLWIAIANPVSDCGCFGDAFILSNWATFWKNVALSIAVAWLCIFNKKAHWVITPALQWLGFIVSGLFITLIGLYGYDRQPLLDFRNYKEGEPLVDLSDTDESGDSEENYRFIYRKDGVEKSFGINDELPDEADGWEFVDRVATEPDNGNHADNTSSDKNFHFWDKDGEDATYSMLSDNPEIIMLLIPEIRNVSAATTWQINSLYDWSRKNDITMFAVASGSEQEIADWEDISMPSYPLFTADDTAIKEVARGNPAVVYLRNDTVMWKSTLKSLDTEDFLAPGISADPMSFHHNLRNALNSFISLYLAAIAVLIALSFIPSLRFIFNPTLRYFKRKADS